MKKLATAAAVAFPLAVTGCAGFTVPTDLDACAAALISANTTNPSKLLAVAAGTTACVRLSKDIIDRLVANILSNQAPTAGMR